MGKERGTEKPTDKRKREARRDGRIARTPDVGAWVGVLLGSLFLPRVLASTLAMARDALAAVPAVTAAPDPVVALHLLRSAATRGLTAFLPLAGAIALSALVLAAAQGGLRVTPRQLKPKPSRLSPKEGAKRLFGAQGWILLAKSLLKIVLLGGVATLVLRRVYPELASPVPVPLAAALPATANAAARLVRAVAVTGLALALAEHVVERRRLGKSLLMTKQEIKEEHRQSEGDPHVRAQIRSRQVQLRRNRMIAEVGTATVVLVNPTHVAVALRYDSGNGAPRVVAKGAGAVARRIREEAARHEVPLVEDVPLARAVYAACELGAEIPPEFYDAVARVLAVVFSLRRRKAAFQLGRPVALGAT